MQQAERGSKLSYLRAGLQKNGVTFFEVHSYPGLVEGYHWVDLIFESQRDYSTYYEQDQFATEMSRITGDRLYGIQITPFSYSLEHGIHLGHAQLSEPIGKAQRSSDIVVDLTNPKLMDDALISGAPRIITAQSVEDVMRVIRLRPYPEGLAETVAKYERDFLGGTVELNGELYWLGTYLSRWDRGVELREPVRPIRPTSLSTNSSQRALYLHFFDKLDHETRRNIVFSQ